MASTRKRKITYIKSNVGMSEARFVVARLFDKHGFDWLSDEQLQQIVSESVSLQRLRQRMNRRNRSIYAAQRETAEDRADRINQQAREERGFASLEDRELWAKPEAA